jgi:Cu2+-exporting ATPase
VRRALERAGAPVLRDITAVEEPGAGIACTIDGIEYRLGAPAWATADRAPAGAELVFAVNGRACAWLATDERLRPDARRELAALRTAGYQVSILSGDRVERVRAIAAALDVDPSDAHGGMRPEDKAAWLAEHDRQDTLFIGDGINDGLAAGAAHISGTPAIDRPFMATRCDFYLTAAGLAPITRALAAARRLAEVARSNLVFTAAYNAGAVTLALSGLMRPWLAAVLMPISSLAVVTATTRRLRSQRWT